MLYKNGTDEKTRLNDILKVKYNIILSCDEFSKFLKSEFFGKINKDAKI